MQEKYDVYPITLCFSLKFALSARGGQSFRRTGATAGKRVVFVLIKRRGAARGRSNECREHRASPPNAFGGREREGRVEPRASLLAKSGRKLTLAYVHSESRGWSHGPPARLAPSSSSRRRSPSGELGVHVAVRTWSGRARAPSEVRVPVPHRVRRRAGARTKRVVGPGPWRRFPRTGRRA